MRCMAGNTLFFSKALFYNEIYYEETNQVKDELDRANLLRDDDWISCDLFHDMLTYKLIQYDRTCQQVINLINMEKTFAPNNFAQKQKFLMDFFLKECHCVIFFSLYRQI